MSFNPPGNHFNPPVTPFKAELEQIMDFLNYQENPNLTDFFGTTLLHFAVTNSYDSYDIVEKLIKAGANVNAQNGSLQAPLHLAVLRHNWRVIDTLLAYDADVNLQEIKGYTALLFAVDVLWSKSPTLLKMRSWVVKKLLHRGADPNISNVYGETPLMIASKYGDLELVRDLLAFGAKVYLRNKNSETCMHLLSRFPIPDIPIMKELLNHGACVNCCDDNGRTALDDLLEGDEGSFRKKLGESIDKDNYCKKLTESFIKFSILANWKYKMIFQVARQHKKKIQSFRGFMDKCYEEVSRMKSYVYSDGSNLCHFVINGSKIAWDESEQGIFDEVLDTLRKDYFPIYDDLIKDHFDYKFLKAKLFETNVYTNNGAGKVYLHSYAVFCIVSYLSDRDLLNLIRSYA